MKFKNLFLLMSMLRFVQCQDSCLVGHNLLGKYDPAAGESRVGHVLIDSKTFHLDTAGGFTGVLKVRKSQLDHEHFFQAIRTSGNYHFYFGQYGNDANFRLEMRDKNNVWCNSDAVGTLVLNQVHEIVFQLVSTTNSVMVLIDGTAYETKCPADFLWEDLETLGACFGGRWKSGTSPWTCQSNAYGSTLGAHYYDGVLRMDQTRQILDSIVVDAPDSCPSCASGNSMLVTIPTNNLVVSIDDHVFKTESAGSSTYNVYSGSSVVNFGEKTWNIFSNGGFTFITKLKIDSSIPFAYTQPRIFVAHDGTSVNPDGLRFQLQGSATSPTLYHIYGQGGSFCGTYNIPVPTDQFLSLVWRYKLGNDRPTLEINGALATGTNTGTCGANFLTSDRTLTNNKMNQQESGTIENFAGEIAGFYGWDRWLDDTEAQTVLDSILVHENDVLRNCVCIENFYQSDIDVAVSVTSQFSFSGSLKDYANGQTIEKIAGTEAYVSDATYGDVLDLNQGSFNIVSDSLSDLLNADAWTVSMWFQPTVSAKNSMLFYRLDITGGVLGTAAYMYTDNRVWIDRYTQSSTAKALKSQILTIGTWYHLVFVSTPTKLELYVDNALSTATGSVTTTESWGTVSLTEKKIGIGANCRDDTDPDCTDHDSHGHLHDMRFYDHALSSSEISLIYNEEDETSKACVSCPASHVSPAGSTSADDCVLQCEANAYKSTTMLDLHKMCGADSAQNCATSAGSGEGFYTGSSAALLDGVLSGDAHRWHSAKGFGEADSLTIDLGRITSIVSVRIYPVSSAYRSRCKIYVSQEPQGHVITEANAGDLCADLSSLDFFQSVAWETATCHKTGRYVNLIFPANKGDWHEVAEVEVKGMCLSCPAGLTSPSGSTSSAACVQTTSCPHGSTLSATGSDSENNCVCAVGYKNNITDTETGSSSSTVIYEKTIHQDLGSKDATWDGYMSWVSAHAGYTVPTVSQMNEFVETVEFANLKTASQIDPGGDHALTTDEWTPVYADDGITRKWYQIGYNSNYPRGTSIDFIYYVITHNTGWYFAKLLPGSSSGSNISPPTCVACEQGTYNSATDVTVCESCHEHATTNTTAHTAATDCFCEAGYFGDGLTTCTACPAGLTSPAGSTSVDDCVCAAGFKTGWVAPEPVWRLSQGGEACNEVCNNVDPSVGYWECDSEAQTAVDTTQEIDDLVRSLGIEGGCDKTQSTGSTYPGVPWMRTESDGSITCRFFGTSGASSCTGNQYTWHRPICRCKVNEALFQDGAATDSAATPTCVACEQGKYNSVTDVTVCESCHEHANTTTTAHTAATDCFCEAGYFGDGLTTCTACPAGLTSPAGSTSVDDCVCAAGYKSAISPAELLLSSAVVQQDDVTLNSYYVDLGTLTFDFGTNGGATFIFKLKQASIGYMAVFTIAGFKAYKHQRLWGNPYRDMSFGCAMQSGTSSSPTTWHAGEWYTVVARYNALNNPSYSYTIYESDDSIHYTTICHIASLDDVTSTENKIGYYAGQNYYAGDFAGFYVWDRYLTDSEVTTVKNAIIINGLDVSSAPADASSPKCVACEQGTYNAATDVTVCESCPAGSTSPAGSISADDCVQCPHGSTAAATGTFPDSCTCHENFHSDLGPVYDGRPPISAWSYSPLLSDQNCNNPLNFGVHAENYVSEKAACFQTVDSNNYLQLDLSTEVIIIGIQTTGRAENAQYVSLYQLEVSSDGVTWTVVLCSDVDTSNYCIGNTDATSVKQNNLATKVVARHVKLTIKAHSGHESIRMSVLAQTCVRCGNIAWEYYAIE